MGFFIRREERVPPHPRQEPRIDLPLDMAGLETVFRDCADFHRRELELAGDENKRVTACYIGGMVGMERAADYVLRPIARDPRLRQADLEEAFRLMAGGALYNLSVEERSTMDEAAADLIGGCLLLLFPGKKTVLSCSVGTEEKRSVGEPENEPAVKGSRDSFVENLRTNTSLVRRHVQAPELKIREQIVGRQSLTPVDILYIEGICDPRLVHQVEKRLEKIDIDALLSAGDLEEYLVDGERTAFPLLFHTERPDRFCRGLVEGRVGVLAEGLPLGYLCPATVGLFFRAPQDRADNWMVASFLTVLRYLCLFITLLLPGFYVAVVNFHQEMIPTKLALSIIAAKQDVPFTTAFEVILLLLAFEVLQEAGLRLPPAIGQTVSILGGLVVGTAAVEARILSPAVLIVVASAGIAGYTQPSQEFAGALRLWRLLLTLLGSVGGLFGVVMGMAVLVLRLGRLESFGVAYLTPFANSGGTQTGGHGVLRLPLRRTVLREAALHPRNRRDQG